MSKVRRDAGISQGAYFSWRNKYAGLMPSEMNRQHEFEQENARLKQIMADLALEKERLQDVIKQEP